MAGVKGKSGGARPNSGGSRPGAGRPPKEPEYLNLSAIYEDPASFLKAVMNDSGSDAKLRVDAAKALLREHGEIGKKDQQKEAARKVASKFAASTPPKLIASGGRKL